ncbi:MAG: hypothetical protein HY547_09340 [Elusimicrobia bacterium]|nr:hypothetical protein [Elusimicrobiota bacterium]
MALNLERALFNHCEAAWTVSIMGLATLLTLCGVQPAWSQESPDRFSISGKFNFDVPWDALYHCFMFRRGTAPSGLEGHNIYYSGDDANPSPPGWDGIPGGNGYNLYIYLYLKDGRMQLDIAARKVRDAVPGLCKVDESELFGGGLYGFSFPPAESVKIWADAGRGGDGGDALAWNSDQAPCAVRPAGRGGDAGWAGDIIVRYSAPELLDYVEFHAEGDLGGRGGNGFHSESGSCPPRPQGGHGNFSNPGMIHLIYEPQEGFVADYQVFKYRYLPGEMRPKRAN